MHLSTGERNTPITEDGFLRIRLTRYVQSISLGGKRRVKVTDHASRDLLQIQEEAARRLAIAGALGSVSASFYARDDERVEASTQLGQRVGLSLAPRLVALVVCPLTILLRARSPLKSFAAGALATSGLFFTPLLLGRSLAEASGRSEWVYLGVGVSLVSAFALTLLAKRR